MNHAAKKRVVTEDHFKEHSNTSERRPSAETGYRNRHDKGWPRETWMSEGNGSELYRRLDRVEQRMDRISEQQGYLCTSVERIKSILESVNITEIAMDVQRLENTQCQRPSTCVLIEPRLESLETEVYKSNSTVVELQKQLEKAKAFFDGAKWAYAVFAGLLTMLGIKVFSQ